MPSARARKLAFGLLFVAVTVALGTAIRSAAADQRSGADPTKWQIIKDPELERASDIWAIIRWTASNVKDTALRYGVVHYGTDPQRLDETATSPNRWNGGLPYMIYRVQVNHLRPSTTYYYRVESVNALNVSEGPESGVHQFTTARSP
jgi:hypothetical protein